MLRDSDWIAVPRFDPEPFDPKNRRAPRPNRDIIRNIALMLADIDRWDRETEGELVFRHDTGVVVQMRRLPADDNFKPNAISSHVVVWMDGMPPFRIDSRIDQDNCAAEFVHAVLLREARSTIEKVGVIAALCAP